MAVELWSRIGFRVGKAVKPEDNKGYIGWWYRARIALKAPRYGVQGPQGLRTFSRAKAFLRQTG